MDISRNEQELADEKKKMGLERYERSPQRMWVAHWNKNVSRISGVLGRY
jgi:SRSO17 transposase